MPDATLPDLPSPCMLFGVHHPASAVLTYYDPDRFDQRNRDWLDRVVAFIERTIVPYHRGEVSGLERIPDGPGMYVANHSGGSMLFDGYIFGAAVYRNRPIEDVPFALAHDMVCDLPVANQLLVPLGAVRASRRNAGELFKRGYKALVYPGGEWETFRPWKERHHIDFGGHTGYIRVALKHDIPLIPVVSNGAHSSFLVLADIPRLPRLLGLDRLLRARRWPVILSLPWGITLGPLPVFLPLPTKIRTEVLDPIRFERSGPAAASDNDYVQECAANVESAMQDALTRLAAKGHGE